MLKSFVKVHEFDFKVDVPVEKCAARLGAGLLLGRLGMTQRSIRHVVGLEAVSMGTYNFGITYVESGVYFFLMGTLEDETDTVTRVKGNIQMRSFARWRQWGFYGFFLIGGVLGLLSTISNKDMVGIAFMTVLLAGFVYIIRSQTNLERLDKLLKDTFYGGQDWEKGA